MRSILLLVLGALGVAGLVVFLTRRGGSNHGNPSQEAERLLDRCRDMLTGLENAVRSFQEPEASSPS